MPLRSETSESTQLGLFEQEQPHVELSLTSMLLNEGELDGVRVLRLETVRQMTQNATGDMATLRGPGWGFTLGFGILTDPAAAKSRLPVGSYGWGGIYGTQFWIDPTNRVVGLVMTQTAIIGSGAIANPIREAFYAAD